MLRRGLGRSRVFSAFFRCVSYLMQRRQKQTQSPSSTGISGHRKAHRCMWEAGSRGRGPAESIIGPAQSSTPHTHLEHRTASSRHPGPVPSASRLQRWRHSHRAHFHCDWTLLRRQGASVIFIHLMERNSTPQKAVCLEGTICPPRGP